MHAHSREGKKEWSGLTTVAGSSSSVQCDVWIGGEESRRGTFQPPPSTTKMGDITYDFLNTYSVLNLGSYVVGARQKSLPLSRVYIIFPLSSVSF